MKEQWFGDSYDLVKRVLLEAVSDSGFEVFADPMITEADFDNIEQYFRLIKAKPLPADFTTNDGTCLFLDPNTGISKDTKKRSKHHITVTKLKERLSAGLIVVYDQSFNFQINPFITIQEKLSELNNHSISGFYYASHANFLFASKKVEVLEKVKLKLLDIGIPSSRLINLGNH